VPPQRLDTEIVNRARSIPIETIIDQRGIKLRGNGSDRSGPCPVCGGNDRFAINTKKQLWNCRGCKKGGDTIELVRFLDGVGFNEACEQLTGKRSSGRSNVRPHLFLVCENPDIAEYERRQRDKARYFFRSSTAAQGTPVEVYLRSRGIVLPVLPTTVRYLPPLKPEHHPAMLVPYGLPQESEPGVLNISEDAITAVQLTLLKPDGSGKADVKPNKITIGSPAGMPMVLAPANDLMGLAITEGCEDAMTAHCATGLGAWAAGGWSSMPKLAGAMPGYIETVTIYADADEGGQRGARDLAEALVARGIEVFVNGLSS
jgi:putative DNA primase/helicase